MNSIKMLDRRVGYAIAAFALLLTTFIPALAFAAQVTERSIELSNSSVSAQNTTYKVKFTAVADAGAFVVDFCSNSPALGTVCTAPTGMNTATVTSPTAGVTFGTNTANKIVVIKAIDADAADVEVEVAGITNSSVAGSVYARIASYDTSTNANLYTSAGFVPTAGGVVDTGSAAFSITPTIGVSGAVLEALTFCVSGSEFDEQGCAGAVTPPNVSLGTNGVLGTTLSEGTIRSMISTNAVGGAVVNLKSNTVGCGGLLRAGAASAAEGCGITPLTTELPTIGEGTAKFGLKFASIVDGTGEITPATNYGLANYFMNYIAGDLTGVTSTYGDPIYNTSGAPISNGKVDLTFGANIGNDTPAGAYSATLNLIATGKF